MRLDPYLIVIVDDDIDTGEILSRALVDDPRFRVLIFVDPDQFLQQVVAKEISPDVTFVDYVMPGRDGLELTRELKENHARTAILMLTSYDDPTVHVKAIAYGAAGVITKPVKRSEVVKILETILGLSRQDG